jgi:hypothetical protein
MKAHQMRRRRRREIGLEQAFQPRLVFSVVS